MIYPSQHWIVQDDTLIIDFVVRAHRGQYRKTGEPFHMHPLRMYGSYLQTGNIDPVISQALLLHDTVEDTDTTLSDIQSMFGEPIASIVDAITCYDSSGNKLTKYEAIQKFIEYSKQDYRCLIVKLFDCIDNLETIHGLSLLKQYRFKTEKRCIYLPIFIAMLDYIPNKYKAMYVRQIEVMRGLLI